MHVFPYIQTRLKSAAKILRNEKLCFAIYLYYTASQHIMKLFRLNINFEPQSAIEVGVHSILVNDVTFASFLVKIILLYHNRYNY